MKTINKSVEFGRITHLLLGNFKAFRRTQRIPIRPITLIYGRNNSGKSSIIQALLYAEHVRRTHELDPQFVTKDNYRLLEGGLARLTYGHGEERPRIGWEWVNQGSNTGLESGSYVQELADDSDILLEAVLNGERFLKLTELEEAWISMPPNQEHPLIAAAVQNIQRLLSAEFRLWIKNKEGNEELRERLSDVCEQLDAGNFAGEVLVQRNT